MNFKLRHQTGKTREKHVFPTYLHSSTRRSLGHVPAAVRDTSHAGTEHARPTPCPPGEAPGRTDGVAVGSAERTRQDSGVTKSFVPRLF